LKGKVTPATKKGSKNNERFSNSKLTHPATTYPQTADQAHTADAA